MSSLFATYIRSNLDFVRGEGAYLFTRDNESYLDFFSGIGVNIFGYNDEDLVSTLKSAANRVWHISNLYHIEEQEKLAKNLCLNSFAESVFFNNSGAEAVECAIKTARRFFYDRGEKNKTNIICFKGAFHGRTLGTIAAGGNKNYLEGFGEPLSGFRHIEGGNIELVEQIIDENIAAILIEPIQGEGGVRVFTDEFLRELREISRKNNILLILDEVQCGFGRTGKLFAHQWADIEPDIMAVAKGIGSGFPLGACLAKKNIAKSMVPGTHGSTYGGNPLACAIGNKVLEKILAPDFLPHVRKSSTYLHQQLQQLMQKFPHLILEVRGRGLMAGLKITPPVNEFVQSLRKNRLLTVGAGENVLRLLPPLIISENHIDEAINIMDKIFAKFAKRAK